jgi:hypothetical protein
MRLGLTSVIAVGAWLVTSGARGEGGDHAVAQGIVDELGRDKGHQAIVAEPVGLAQKALERALRFRTLGDEARARAADGLAREWAETARDLVRAADAEARATEVRRKALEEGVQLERTRALVDEGIARVGRLKAELEEAQRAAAGDTRPDRHAVEQHDGDTKAPKKAAAKSPPGAKPGSAGAAP